MVLNFYLITYTKLYKLKLKDIVKQFTVYILFNFFLTENIYDICEESLVLSSEDLVLDKKEVEEVLECNFSSVSELNCYENSFNDALDENKKELNKSHDSGQ